MKNANQVAPAALARAGVCATGMVASKFSIDSEDRARWASSLQMGAGPSFFFLLYKHHLTMSMLLYDRTVHMTDMLPSPDAPLGRD